MQHMIFLGFPRDRVSDSSIRFPYIKAEEAGKQPYTDS